MPDIHDFHAFTSTSSGGSTGGSGCSGCLVWVLGGLFFLWLIGTLFV